MVFVAAVKQHPEIASMADGNAVAWLRGNVQATATDNNSVEIGISGLPKDRKRLQAVVDAIAEQLINSLDAVRRRPSNGPTGQIEEPHVTPTVGH